MTQLPSDVSHWLNALNAALGSLPADARTEIVAETRGHIQDRIAAGLSSENTLHGFGDPRAYARTFLDDYALTTALDSKRIWPMIKTLASFTSRSIVALFGLIATLTFGGIALGSVVSIVLKMIRPDKVGLWVGNDHVILGATNMAAQMHEIAGNWVYLIFIAMLAVGAVLARYSLIGSLYMIKGKRAQLAA